MGNHNLLRDMLDQLVTIDELEQEILWFTME